jgi:hypothetical protein
LEANQVFRPRVLALFTNYRKEWRNPAAHDYKLDFDESEALLACVSVAAFACLVSDQIAEQLAFLDTKKSTGRRRRPLKAVIGKDGVVSTLAERVAGSLLQFAQLQKISPTQAPQLESQLIGSVAGYLTAITPKDSVLVDQRLTTEGRERADLLVRSADESIIVELKYVRSSKSVHAAAIAQVEHYLTVADATAGVLYLAATEPGEYELIVHEVPNTTKKIYVVGPKQAA